MKLLAPLLFFAFLFLALGSPLAMLSMDHHGMGDCPFMPGEQALCDMAALAHLSRWQGALAAALPSPLLFALLLFTAFVVSRVFALRTDGPPVVSCGYRPSSRPGSLSFAALCLGSAISPRAP